MLTFPFLDVIVCCGGGSWQYSVISRAQCDFAHRAARKRCDFDFLRTKAKYFENFGNILLFEVFSLLFCCQTTTMPRSSLHTAFFGTMKRVLERSAPSLENIPPPRATNHPKFRTKGSSPHQRKPKTEDKSQTTPRSHRPPWILPPSTWHSKIWSHQGQNFSPRANHLRFPIPPHLF